MNLYYVDILWAELSPFLRQPSAISRPRDSFPSEGQWAGRGASSRFSTRRSALLDAILHAPSGTPMTGQFDASAYDVAKHIDAAAIPDDIKTFVTEIAALV